LLRGARVHAAMAGRHHLAMADVHAIVPLALEHRLVLDYSASHGNSRSQIVADVVRNVLARA